MQQTKPRLLRWLPPTMLLPPGSKYVIHGVQKMLGYVDEHSTTSEKDPAPIAQKTAVVQHKSGYSPSQYVIVQTFVSSVLDHIIDKRHFDLDAVRAIATDLGISLSLVKLMEKVPFGSLVYSLRNLQQSIIDAKTGQEQFVSVLKFLVSMGITSACQSTPVMGPVFDAAANHYILPYIDVVAKTEIMKRASKRFDKTVQDASNLVFKSKL
jgi:hypothetical protein